MPPQYLHKSCSFWFPLYSFFFVKNLTLFVRIFHPSSYESASKVKKIHSYSIRQTFLKTKQSWGFMQHRIHHILRNLSKISLKFTYWCLCLWFEPITCLTVCEEMFLLCIQPLHHIWIFQSFQELQNNTNNYFCVSPNTHIMH